MELFDEENIHTALADQWENYGTLNYIEDERRENLADAQVERGELLRQIFAMIQRCLDRQESDILCAYYGLQTKRQSVERLALNYGVTTKRIMHIVKDAEEKLRYSDDAIQIWKYLYRK
jgi:DNA-directed RNA polymerase sigma subunit (sigma70/sigma32)